MAVLMVFTGCNPAPSNNGSVKIYLSDASSKAINPDGADSWAGLGIDSYELVISNNGTIIYSKEYAELPNEAIELSLPVGKYDFAANAKSGSTVVAKAEQKDVIVSSRNNASVKLVIDAFGTGNVEVKFSYADDSVSNGNISAILTNLATKAEIEMTVEDGKVVANDVPVGSYILDLIADVKLVDTDLTEEKKGVFIKSDIVYVENGKTSSAAWIIKYEGNKASISIDSNVGTPVSFNIQAASNNAEYVEEEEKYYIPVDSEVTLKAVGSNIDDYVFEWNFDGAKTTGSEVTVCYDSYDLGKLSLLVTAKAGSTYGYGYKTWTIESTDFVNNEYHIGSVERLQKFSDEVYAANTLFTSGNIVLDCDLDLEGSAANPWTPIRGTSSYTGFAGSFDGQGNTIKNLYVEAEKCAGLFATMCKGSIKNLNIENVTLRSNHFAGAIVAWIEVGSSDVVIDNCKVTNADILVVPNMVNSGEYDNGDKAGSIVGFNYCGNITNCSVENASIRAYRDLGGIAGYAKGAIVTGNTISKVTLTSDQATNWYADKDANANAIVGRVDNSYPNTIENNTGDAAIFTVSKDNKTSFGNIEDNAILNVPSGNYGSFPPVTAKNVTIICEEGTVFEGENNINLNGATVENAIFKNDAASAVKGEINGTFKNCTFEGLNAMYYSYAGETVVFENCVFKGQDRAVHFDSGANDVKFINCEFHGTISLGAAVTMTTMENCTVYKGLDGRFNIVNFYNASYVKDTNFVFDGSASKESIRLWYANSDASKHVFEGCKINGSAFDVKYTLEKLEAGDKITVDNSIYTCNGSAFKNEAGDYVAYSGDGIANVIKDASASADSDVDIAIPEANIVFPSSVAASTNAAAKKISISGAGIDKTVLTGSVGGGNNPGNYANYQDLYFKDLTFETANSGYSGGFGHAKSVTFENCKIVGQFYCHSGAPHKFINCTIDPLNGYLYTYASDCEFINCKFEASEGKALQVYEDGTVGANKVIIDDCTFVAAKQATTWDGKPVTPIDINSNGASFEVIINNCESNGFPKGLNSDSDLWNVKNTNLDVYKVTVDGAQVYPYYYVDDATGSLVVNSANGLESALGDAGAAGAGSNTIVVTEDIDLTGKEWAPIKVDGYHGADIITLDGGDEGITIKGLTSALFAGGFAGGSGIVIKNITIEDSYIIADNDQGYGAFVCCADSMDKITLLNCHLKNSTIITPNDGADESRIGGLVGWTAGYNNPNDGPVDSYITIENCSVTGCEIKGAGSIGGIVGHAGANPATFTTIKNCVVENNTFISTDDGEWRVGVVVGTANNGQCSISGITESNNAISQVGKTAPAGQSNLYGRFVPAGTGTLTIDGVSI